jgi:leucyl/phenylalanyl-tRNA--protein transferase
MRRVPLLPPAAPPTALPPAHRALDEPAGLVAAGGALTPDWLRHAYRQGIFPWFSDTDPILWWSPDPRTVFYPGALRIARSLRQSVRNRGYLVSVDVDFAGVVAACAAPRLLPRLDLELLSNREPDDSTGGTWIGPAMAAAYLALHHAGDAHAIEVWQEDQLVGGLYGVALGGLFFGESMFSSARDASKIALLTLAAECQDRGIEMIDCQFLTPHLASLGALEISRPVFLNAVARLTGAAPGHLETAPRAWERPRAPPRLPRS